MNCSTLLKDLPYWYFPWTMPSPPSLDTAAPAAVHLGVPFNSLVVHPSICWSMSIASINHRYSNSNPQKDRKGEGLEIFKGNDWYHLYIYHTGTTLTFCKPNSCWTSLSTNNCQRPPRVTHGDATSVTRSARACDAWRVASPKLQKPCKVRLREGHSTVVPLF